MSLLFRYLTKNNPMILLPTLPVGIGLSFAVWVIFSQLLMLNLPAGPLEHLIFSGT
mgnify:CR=1 FL=1